MKKYYFNAAMVIAILSVLLTAGCASGPGTETFSSQNLSPSIIAKLSESVFEVVTPKLGDGSVVYERPLPLDSLPFSERNDTYNSIGTAFLMDDGRFYSASHVFGLQNVTLCGDYFIRDGDGAVYRVTRVDGLSTNRDFIVFEVEGFEFRKGMGLTAGKEDAALNTVVFSVGNALGQGIVIRDGILTSRTFEDENGAWKWLRFSAAASPGNSGGPLVNAAGDVLGIITMKSANENLNYALPFSEIQNVAPGTDVFHARLGYAIPNILSKKFQYLADYTFSLPADIKDVRALLTAENKRCTSAVVAKAREEFAVGTRNSFANGNGKYSILLQKFFPQFPAIMALSSNNTWGAYNPSSDNLKEYALKDNGKVRYSTMMDVNMAYIVKPESVTVSNLVSSPKTYMDYILESISLFRKVGIEQVIMTSLGDPAETDTYTDYYGRVWNVSYWHLPFANSAIITYALPLPTGMYVMYRIDEVSNIYNGHNYDLAFMADYVIPKYDGTLKEWNEFLSLPAGVYPLPPVLKTFSLRSDNGTVSLSTPDFKVNLNESLINLKSKGIVRLYLGYIVNGNAVTERVESLDVYSDPKEKDFRRFILSRNLRPPKDATQELKDFWKQLCEQLRPYDGVPFDIDNADTGRVEILFHTTPLDPDTADVSELYALSCSMRGKDKNDEVTAFADELKKAIVTPSR